MTNSARGSTSSRDPSMRVEQSSEQILPSKGRKLTVIHNVDDRRHSWIDSWEVEPLIYESLTDADVGRTVIYRDHGRCEAGTLSSFRNGIVFARYSKGDTAAGANPSDLCFGISPISEGGRAALGDGGGK